LGRSDSQTPLFVTEGGPREDPSFWRDRHDRRIVQHRRRSVEVLRHFARLNGARPGRAPFLLLIGIGVRLTYHWGVTRGKVFALLVTAGAVLALVIAGTSQFTLPSNPTLLFWLGAILAAGLLPVTLGFGAVVTMQFPLVFAVAILFDPFVAMVIVGLASFDVREIRHEIPLWRTMFNRSQLMLATGAASALIGANDSGLFSFPEGFLGILWGAAAFLLVNLGLVTVILSLDRGVPIREAISLLLPRPVVGFWLTQVVLAAFGVATAAVYMRIEYYVVVFLIPLLFARLSILGARAQQELSDKVQKQQHSLLEATERVFQERENERHRIAEEIHDSSLQMLAAATYGLQNAAGLIENEHPDDAAEAIESVRGAVDGAIHALRSSLVDLRRSAVEQGGLMETIKIYADQTSLLWNREIRLEGDVTHEPPIPIALAAFQILQEGLTNSLKHAKDSPITVRIDELDSMVHIVVEDQGPGFDPEVRVGEDHVGVKLMRERAARVGGRLELASQPGSGTRLEAILPAGVAH
jgi:signal transduction histidine kinase